MNRNSEELANAFGYLHLSEIGLLRGVLADIEDDRPVLMNIGAGPGTSGLVMRECKPKAIIFTLDNTIDSPFGGLQGEQTAFREAEQELPYQILIDSGEMVKYWANQTIDLCFVDGDHSAYGVERDLQWVKKVKQGGFILFHDFENDVCPDVAPTVRRYFHREPDLLVRMLAVYRVGKPYGQK
jgi:predicted O-methyltransferase YrrM